jgi:crotonobetainyl-CoA:carnitine CoA-transferase CaiB-like acyl-CoA transferase
LQSTLQAAGIAAAKSLNTIDLVADRELWDGGFFPSITDCSGEARSIIGPAWTMSRPAALNRGAPALGEDNAYVLGDLLGLSNEEQEQLAKDGIMV